MNKCRPHLLAISLIVFGVSFACVSKDSIDDVRKNLSDRVQAGSSKSDVIKYLENASFSVSSNPEWAQPPDCTSCEWLTATREGQNIFGTYFVKVDLYFDKSNELLKGFEIYTVSAR